jgi:hypothetical protein
MGVVLPPVALGVIDIALRWSDSQSDDCGSAKRKERVPETKR